MQAFIFFLVLHFFLPSMSRFSQSGRLPDPSVGQDDLFVLPSPRFFEPTGGFTRGLGFGVSSQISTLTVNLTMKEG